MKFLVGLIVAVVGELAILQVLGASGITGVMWLLFAAVLPGSLFTAWMFAALKTA